MDSSIRMADCSLQQAHQYDRAQVQSLTNIAVEMIYLFHRPQWDDRDLRAEEEGECELFQGPLRPRGELAGDPIEQDLFMEHQDELQAAIVPQAAQLPDTSNQNSVRCVDGRIAQPEEESPSNQRHATTIQFQSLPQEESDWVQQSHLALDNHLQVYLRLHLAH